MLIAWSKRRDFRRSLLPRYEVDIFRKFVGIGIPNLIDAGFVLTAIVSLGAGLPDRGP